MSESEVYNKIIYIVLAL